MSKVFIHFGTLFSLFQGLLWLLAVFQLVEVSRDLGSR